MSSYVKPQVLVFQEFRIVPTEITEPLRAHISGPHAILHRYSDSTEKAGTGLGVYNFNDDAVYSWPQREAGSLIDFDYLKVYIDDAMLRYYLHNMGENDTTITSVPGKSNWIQSSSLSFRANGVGYPRSSAFADRDVKVGDVVRLRAVSQDDDCEETVLETEVVGFASDMVPSRILPATEDVNNEDAYTATAANGVDVVVNQVAGFSNTVVATVLTEDDTNGNDYNGLVDGYVKESYTVEVVKSSIAGCQAARLRVTSASGTDDVAEIQPNAFDDPDAVTPIGTRGLTVKFSAQGSDQFVVGQRWKFDVDQTFAPAFAQSFADGVYATEASVTGVLGEEDILGKYAGQQNDVYVIECTKGGTWEQLPQVTVKTVKGLDFSGPTEVTGDGLGIPSISVPVGTNGVKVRFYGDAAHSAAVPGLLKGDKWYITVNASTAGPVRRLILKDDLPAELQVLDDQPIDKVGPISITNNGSGYRLPPDVSFSAPTGDVVDATTALGTAIIGTNVNDAETFGKVIGISVTNRGVGYEAPPTITITPDPKDVLGGQITSITLSNAGSGYTAPPTVQISAPDSADAAATQATATASINGAGEVTSITVTDGGAGYTDASTVTVTIVPANGDTTGAGAVVNAVTTSANNPAIVDAEAEVAALISGEDMDLELFIKDDIQVSENRAESAGLLNYEYEPTQILINSGIVAYHPEWTSAGAPQPLPVRGGQLFVEYREWLADLADEVNSINDVADLDQIAGQLDPDNPLKWGVYKALANSNGTAVKYTAVNDPKDLDSWVQVLERIKGRDDMYNLVPLTFDVRIHNLWAAHIDAESNEYANNWKAGFAALRAQPRVKVAGIGTPVGGVLGTEVEDEVLATLSDDPEATNTQYTKLHVTTGNGNFIVNDVRAGDIVRYNFAVDSFGDETYDEYVVDRVLSNDTLLLFSGSDSAVTVGQRVEIYHDNNRNEIVEHIVQQAGALSNRRMCAVWPDQVGEAGTNQPGYYLAAALAGLASGVVPHQPLTNVEVAGFDDFTRSYKFFNETQLNRLGEGGVWIVTEDRDGTPHTRHGLTTDNLDLNRREEMIRRNVDSISYLFYRRLRPYIGRTNAQPGMLIVIENEVRRAIKFLTGNGFTQELGGQLISGDIATLRIHPLLADRIEVVLNLVVPAPLNNIELHLVI